MCVNVYSLLKHKISDCQFQFGSTFIYIGGIVKKFKKKFASAPTFCGVKIIFSHSDTEYLYYLLTSRFLLAMNQVVL